MRRDYLKLVEEFVKQTRKYKFTYNDFRRWYYKSGKYREWGIEWHAIERGIRKLAEEGYIKRLGRVGKHGRMLFMFNKKVLDIENEIKELINEINRLQFDIYNDFWADFGEKMEKARRLEELKRRLKYLQYRRKVLIQGRYNKRRTHGP